MFDQDLMLDVLVKFLLATLLAGAVGLERERKGRAAGLRTHVLVCLGSTLAMIISDALAQEWGAAGAPVWLDRGRIAAGILTGVGFLGAGTIINVGGLHRGLTTAAMIWFVAALGIAIGTGYYVVGALGTAFVLLAVVGLEGLENLFPSSDHYIVTLEVPRGLERAEDIAAAIHSLGFMTQLIRLRTTGAQENVEIAFEVSSRSKLSLITLVDTLRTRFPEVSRVDCTR